MTEADSAACMRGAFQALLRGDLAERDRLCNRAEALMKAENEAAKVARVLSVDFYVTAAGTSIPTKKMAAAARAIQ